MLKKLMITAVLGLASASSYAWQVSSNVTIVELIAWESLDDGGPLHFKLSNNAWCYVPSGKKTLHSLIMSLYVSGKTVAEIHCHDTADSNAGGSVAAAYKLHRIIAK
jgi:hypothetical protein